jgi:hypothetical protein
MANGMFCRNCLYDLSRTRECRCPECGAAFNPRLRTTTTLPTDSRLQWSMFQAKLLLAGLRPYLTRNRKKYCRECFSDLTGLIGDRCHTCQTWFDPSDPDTYRRSNHALAVTFERFRHICFWRGVLLPIIPFWIGISALITRHTLLPGAGRMGISAGRMMRLEGWPAVSMGWAWLGLAFALHAHYFWGRVNPIWRLSMLGVIVGIITTAIGWGAALVWAFEHVWN